MNNPLFDIYHASPDESCRFALGKGGRRVLAVVGLNPSTADQYHGDATATRVERVARQSGFDGFVLVNLASVRATHPVDLPKELEQELVAENLLELRKQLLGADGVWAAWGVGVLRRSYLAQTLEGISDLPLHWQQFGPCCLHGHPRHPSRLSYQWRFSDFSLPSYLDNLVKH